MDGSKTLSDIPQGPTPGQYIHNLWAWIATYPDGTEGIVAAGISGIGLTTLISSKRDVAMSMETLAKAAVEDTFRNTRQRCTVKLVRFVSVVPS
jgi:hypothetical protein